MAHDHHTVEERDTGAGLGVVLGVILAIVLAAVLLWFLLGSSLSGGGAQTSPGNNNPQINVNPPAQPSGPNINVNPPSGPSNPSGPGNQAPSQPGGGQTP